LKIHQWYINEQVITSQDRRRARIIAKKIIIATGDSSIVPEAWEQLSPSILTSENIFEQEYLQDKIAVIGAGSIGLELGQALSRLNIEIAAFHSHEFIAKLSDPVVNETAIKIFEEEFPIYTGNRASIEKKYDVLQVSNDNHTFSARQVLATLGRKPNLRNLNLEKIGISVNEFGIPLYNPETMQVDNLPIFIAGDVDHDKPLLHEAADEGRIAGYNAVREDIHCFKRRTPLNIVFTQPNIAMVGRSHRSLKDMDVIIGEVNFNDQGRSRIMNQNKGILHIYANREHGELLGAEMIAPAGEHLAHLLSWAIQQKMTVFDMLQMPFYHPVVEEGCRTALRDLTKQVSKKHKIIDLAMCESETI